MKKSLIILVLINVITFCFAKDLEIVAMNYNCSQSELKCELLIQNKSSKMLYVMSPENSSFNENQNSKNLIIKTFSEKNLKGDFSLNNAGGFPVDFLGESYSYSFFTDVKSNDFVVLFFDFKLTEFPFKGSSIRNFSDYDIIKIQCLYSEKPEPTIGDEIFISEFALDLKTNSVKAFDIYDYVDKWDDSIIFLENDEFSHMY